MASESSDAAAISKESTMEEERSDAAVNTALEVWLEKAMKEGYVSLNNINMVICGPPAVGKTAFQDLLLNKPPLQEYNSTPIARPIEAVQITGNENWEEPSNDDLLHMLSDAIKKACTISSPEEESSTTSDTPSPVHEAVSSQEDTTSIEPSPKDAVPTTQASDDTTTPYQPTSNIATPKSSEVTTPSEVKILLEKLREQLANVAKIEASQPQELLKPKWIHLLDSGGQPQFTDLLPMFVRDNSSYIIVMKATESLHDKPAFLYSVDGKPVRASNDLTMTNLEIIENSVRSIVAAPRDKEAAETSSSADDESKQMFVILATHIDKLQSEDLDARLKEYNEKILERLDKFRDHFIFYEYESNQLIFPVNNRCEGPDRQNKAAKIRKCLMSQSDKMSFNKKIPIHWYIFNILMKEEALKETHGMISFESCEVIGNECGMHPNMVKDCLKYLDSMGLCIYYHKVLPKVVFTNPQFLVDRLSEIVRVSFAKDLQKTLPEGAKSCSENGVFDESLLDNLRLNFDFKLFSKSDLLKLLKHFNVISPIKADANTGTSQYFMPILLPPKRLTEEQKDCLEEKNDPLHITFKDRIFPKALFPIMVVSLLSREEEPFFFIDCPSDDDFFPRQLRHAVKLYSEDLFGSIFLCEEYESIEVYFAVPRKHYYVLRKVILKALEASAKTLGYNEKQLKVSAIVKLRSDTHDSDPSSTSSFNNILRKIKSMRNDGKGQLVLKKSDNLEEVKKKCYNQVPVYFKKVIIERKETLAIELEEVPEAKYILPEKFGSKKDYDDMNKQFNDVLKRLVDEALKKKSLDDVKQCLMSTEDTIKSEAKVVEDEESLKSLLQQYCSLSNISLLKRLAVKLALTELKERIDELNDKRNGFYTSLLVEDYSVINERMVNHAEITVVVSKNLSKKFLAEILDFLKIKLKNGKRALSLQRTVVQGNELSIVCNIPAQLVEIYTEIIACAGLSLKVRQVFINNINVYNNPDEGAEREGVKKEDSTQSQLYGCPLPLSDKEFPENFKKLLKKDVVNFQDLVTDIEVILMTATIAELTAVMGYLEPKDGEKEILYITYGSYYFYVGKYGQYPVAVVMSAPDKGEQGPISAIHHLYNITSAVKQIKYIIAVGVCYGMNSKVMNLTDEMNSKVTNLTEKMMNPADIIVSDIVCDATCLRVGPKVELRGSHYKAGDKILKTFDQARNSNFEMTRDNAGNKVEVKVGHIISRPDLVDDPKYKEQLREAWKEHLAELREVCKEHLREAWEEHLDELRKPCDKEQLTELEEKCKEQLRKAWEEQLTELREACNEQLTKLREVWKEQLTELSETCKKQLREACDNEQLTELKEKCKEQLRKAWKEQLTELRKEWKKQLTELREARKEPLRKAWNEQLTELKKAWKEQLREVWMEQLIELREVYDNEQLTKLSKEQLRKVCMKQLTELSEACERLDALGGEMEGAGIMSFAHHHKNIEAIIIKAISDWGDSKKDEMKGWKNFAAHAAAGYVHFVMKKDPVPEVPAKHFPKLTDIETEYKHFSKDLVQDITVLLMTATGIELRGIMGYLEPKDGDTKIIKAFANTQAGIIKFYIGKYGQYPVAVGMTAPHQGPLDTCLVTARIIEVVKPRYVIAVGICYGMDKSKTSSGDVIVSEHICDFTCLRVGVEDILQPCGGIPSVGATLFQVFSSPIGYSHTYQDGKKKVKVHCSPFISRPDLVDNPIYKEQLKRLRPDALGGEMEGANIMVAIQNAEYKDVEAIVIKAICDWGDGEKSEAADWKDFLSHAAARYVHHQMEKYPDVLNKKTK